MKARFILLIFSFSAAFITLSVNLYHVQIEKGALYAAKAQAQYASGGILLPERGIISFTDKNGNDIPAVLNKDYPIVFAVPKQIEDAQETAARTTAVLGLSEAALVKKFSKPNDAYELLATKLTADQVARIKEASIPGIYVDEQEFRFYPFGNHGV
mgnify:FL=1